MTDFRERTDEELAKDADLGLRGQGSVVEMMNRLKRSIENLDRSSAKLGKRVIWLTVVILVLTAIMAIPVVLQAYHWIAGR